MLHFQLAFRHFQALFSSYNRHTLYTQLQKCNRSSHPYVNYKSTASSRKLARASIKLILDLRHQAATTNFPTCTSAHRHNPHRGQKKKNRQSAELSLGQKTRRIREDKSSRARGPLANRSGDDDSWRLRNCSGEDSLSGARR